jgi:hypothetical protein
MIAGSVFSVIVFAAGAIMDFAVSAPYQHGVNFRTVGVILMAVGAAGLLFSILGGVFGSTWHRHRTVVDDGQGNVIRREDTYV